MIDPLLYAVRDAIRTAGYGYGVPQCDIMPDGYPPQQCGNIFVAVHQGPTRSTNDNCLMEYWSFIMTLTMRVKGIPLSRIGDQMLARKLADKVGFNAKAMQLRALMHMNWGVLQDANTLIVELNPDATTVYGFCEPARFRGMEVPVLVSGEWFGAEPQAADMGLKADLRFEDARTMQPMAIYV